MGQMKDFLITVHNGGDEAVAAVQRVSEDWRAQLEQAADEIERLRKREALWQWCAERTTETYGGCYRPEYAEKVEAAAREFAAGDATGSEERHERSSEAPKRMRQLPILGTVWTDRAGHRRGGRLLPPPRSLAGNDRCDANNAMANNGAVRLVRRLRPRKSDALAGRE